MFAAQPAQQSPTRLPSSLASGVIADLRSRLLAGVPFGLTVGAYCMPHSSLPLPGHWPNGLPSGSLPIDQPSAALSGPTNILLCNLRLSFPAFFPAVRPQVCSDVCPAVCPEVCCGQPDALPGGLPSNAPNSRRSVLAATCLARRKLLNPKSAQHGGLAQSDP